MWKAELDPILATAILVTTTKTSIFTTHFLLQNSCFQGRCLAVRYFGFSSLKWCCGCRNSSSKCKESSPWRHWPSKFLPSADMAAKMAKFLSRHLGARRLAEKTHVTRRNSLYWECWLKRVKTWLTHINPGLSNDNRGTVWSTSWGLQLLTNEFISDNIGNNNT